MLSLRQVTVRFEGAASPAVDAVSLELPPGQVLAVLGPSGSGKSTLLRAVAGLEEVASGSVAYDGQDLAPVPTHRRGFALMFQDGQLFPHLSVAGNIGYALRLPSRRLVPRLLRTGPSRRLVPRLLRTGPDRERVAELLDLVGLSGYGERSISGLSGGERQRVALARALAVEPRLLLLDEPLSALDRGLRERLARDLRDILVAAGTTALLVTHDQEEAFALADRMALLREGRLVQSGSVADVWRAPADAEAARFLGYATVLEGEAASRVLAAAEHQGRAEQHERAGRPEGGPVLALRRSALRVSRDGRLRGRVLAVRATPDVVRLEVEVEGVGVLAAVADPQASVPPVGGEVALVLDVIRTARLRP